MLSAVFENIKQIKITDTKISKLDKASVLVKVMACGVCGTDFHIFNGEAPAARQIILGHEYAGEVVEIGEDVNEIAIGDKVAVNPNIHCGYCKFCKAGKINLCENLKALGVTQNGGLAEYSVVPISQAYLIPNDFSIQSAAFAEPLSCCVHGINQAEIKLNDTVAIVGCGTIGLLMLQLAILKGASKVFALDVSSEKLIFATKLNAAKTFNVTNPNLLEEIIDITSGGVDVAIECVGNSNAVETAIRIVRKGGNVLIFGLSGDDEYIKLYLQKFFHKEITLKTSLLNPFTFQTAVELLTSSKINVDLFNPTKMNLTESDINKIFNSPRSKDVIKYMVFPNN